MELQMRALGRPIARPAAWSYVVAALCLCYSAPTAAQNLSASTDYCLQANDSSDMSAVAETCSAVIDNAAESAANRSTAFLHRGNARRVQGDVQGAVVDFDQAIQLSPQDWRAFLARANSYLMLGNGRHAIADFDRVIALNPQSVAAFHNRGIAHSRQHDYASAIADFSEAIRLAPQNAISFYTRANTYLDRGDYARAIADYDQAIRLQPNNAGWLNGRCWARAVWGQQLDQALADCDASLRIADEPNTLDSRGLVHLRRGAFQAAFADYDAAVRGANLIGSLYGRGVARLRLGQTAEGQADIAAATARDAGVADRFAAYGVTP